jgi:hypothetical protein
VTYASRPHSSAFLAAARALWPNSVTGARVGDAIAPADTTLPYAIAYPLGSATFDGSLDTADLDGDAWPLWQITSVGGTREQAEFLRDKFRALLGTYLTVAGRRVGPIRLDDEQAVQIDKDVTPHLFYAVDRLRLYSTPS